MQASETSRKIADFETKIADLTTRELKIFLNIAQKEVEKRDKPITSLELKDNKLYFNSEVHTIGFDFTTDKRFIHKKADKIILQFPTINKLLENFNLGETIGITKYDLSNKEALVNSNLINMLLIAFTIRGYLIDVKEGKNGDDVLYMRKHSVVIPTPQVEEQALTIK